eukprot:TRINITY_DN17305_c0_g1_i2.p1 TRINITY_DN17305_c0_g1~~TRINITY_DN17305_c0_g1_i2.p1  ORF type:complete len:635 (-),score=143.55 TRINITY_DN17305_c0_g1_i2:22-1926(-)
MIRRPPRSTLSSSSAASDVYKRQVLDIEGQTVETELNKLHAAAMGSTAGTFSSTKLFDQNAPTIYLINPRKEKLMPGTNPVAPQDAEEEFTYRYRYAGAGASQVWLAKKKFVVADVAAGPMSLGAMNDHKGSASMLSIPRSADFHVQSGSVFTAKLVGLVRRVVQHMFIADIQHPTHETAEKIYIPLLVFRNHRQFDPLDKSSGDFQIDVAQIEKQVNKMLLPNQKAHVMAETLNVGDHVHVSMALARAVRDNTVLQVVPGHSKFYGSKESHYEMRYRRYLDSDIIRYEFNRSSHMLDSVGPEMSMLRKRKELWNFFHPMVPPVLDRNELHGHSRLTLSQGVRVLPVYVFSLLQLQHQLLIDQNSLVSSSQESIFVLQPEPNTVQMPNFIDKTRLSPPKQDSTTQQIVAGLMSGLGGLVPPTARWSPLHGREVHDWALAVGCQPWAPFSATPELSELASSMVLRNFILTNLNSAQHTVWKVLSRLDHFTHKYLYDPFAERAKGEIGFFLSLATDTSVSESPFPMHTVNALNAEMDKLRAKMQRIVELVEQSKLTQAYTPASSLVERARAFEVYAETELETAESALSCCSVEHRTSKVVDTHAVIYISGSAILVFSCVILMFRAGSQAPRRRRFG